MLSSLKPISKSFADFHLGTDHKLPGGWVGQIMGWVAQLFFLLGDGSLSIF